ncbi:MAG TPA: hypothetical protein V6C96_03600, partial [Vampirovibrionales bacterium]
LSSNSNSFVFDRANQSGLGQNFSKSFWKYLLKSGEFELYPSLSEMGQLRTAPQSTEATSRILNYQNVHEVNTLLKKKFKVKIDVDENRDGSYLSNETIIRYTTDEEAGLIDLSDIIAKIIEDDVVDSGEYDMKVLITDDISGTEREFKDTVLIQKDQFKGIK